MNTTVIEDQKTWRHAATSARSAYTRLSIEDKNQLDSLISTIMRLKEELVAQALSAGSASLCRSCGGQCCLHGKYYFSTLDLLAYLATDETPVEPAFSTGPLCPYAAENGCSMPSRFRPLPCVIFNCDGIEEQMDGAGKRAFREAEKQLRKAVSQADQLSNRRLSRALLLSTDE